MRQRGITADGNKIASLRLEKQWTQAELAQKAGIQVRTVVTLEKGDRVAGSTLEAVAKALNAGVEQLSITVQPSAGSSGAMVRRDAQNSNYFEVGTYKYFRYGIDDALFDFKRHVLQEMRKDEAIEIRWLGVTMRYGASILSDLCAYATVPVHFELAMLAPNSRILKTLGQHWREEATGHYAALRSCLREYFGKGSRNTGALYVYDEQPHIHGFSLNSRSYYVSWAGYDKNGIFQIVGTQGYDYYEAGNGRTRDQNRIELFDSWFEHFRSAGQQRFPEAE